MIITLTLTHITDEQFGNYYLNNSVGKSELVKITKVEDEVSMYTEWSRWSCKDDCYMPYHRADTRELRTRRCRLGVVD